MGLSPYSTPADAGVLCVILVNTAISISIVKEIVRSILNVIGIHIAPWEEYSMEGPLDTFECRATPSESYMEDFRSQTPTIRYDSVCISHHSEKECPVCLTDFAPDAEINRLSCGHVFHRLCLEKWLKCWSVTCPLCRNCMMPHEGDEDTCPMWVTFGGLWNCSINRGSPDVQLSNVQSCAWPLTYHHFIVVYLCSSGECSRPFRVTAHQNLYTLLYIYINNASEIFTFSTSLGSCWWWNTFCACFIE